MVQVHSLLLLLLLPLKCQSIHLDVHVPLPHGCLYYHALRANRLLRQASPPRSLPPTQISPLTPSEEVDLFTQHTPHVTLYLADFALEDDDAQTVLNQTKVEDFVKTISSINFTEIVAGLDCPLSFAKDQSTSAYYKINGAYTMLPIENTQCLQALSDQLVHTLQPYLRRPIIVPSWVASLPEPARSAAIYRCRTWGSPNVFEEFEPHVTVGYDPISSDSSRATTHEWRVDAMEQWNEAFIQVRETLCTDEVQGIALGKTGVGGTVLANTRMRYWKFGSNPNSDGPPLIDIRNENTHVE